MKEVKKSDLEIISRDIDSVTVKKNGDGEFKVLMFTDTHITGNKELAEKTIFYLRKNIQEQKPDLVLFGGDNVTFGDNKIRNVEFAELMESFGVYWAAVLGNHEGEGKTALPRKDIISLYSSCDHCLISKGLKNIDGNGNCTINILNADGTLRKVFFLLDSGNCMTLGAKLKYKVNNLFGSVYDGVKPSQVEWYKNKTDTLEAEYGKFTSVAVMHIPPKQFEREYSESDFLYGKKREDICESGFDGGLVDALIEKGSTMAIYFGHDHINDFGVMIGDILFSYIQSSGYDTYTMESNFNAPENKWLQGCTLLNISYDGSYTAERILNHQ